MSGRNRPTVATLKQEVDSLQRKLSTNGEFVGELRKMLRNTLDERLDKMEAHVKSELDEIRNEFNSQLDSLLKKRCTEIFNESFGKWKTVSEKNEKAAEVLEWKLLKIFEAAHKMGSAREPDRC